MLYYFEPHEFKIQGQRYVYSQPKPFCPAMYVFRIRWVNRETGFEGIGEYVHPYEQARAIYDELSYTNPNSQYILQVEGYSEFHPHAQYMRQLKEQECARVVSVEVHPVSSSDQRLEKLGAAEVQDSTDEQNDSDETLTHLTCDSQG
jgi:hypothetical protein